MLLTILWSTFSLSSEEEMPLINSFLLSVFVLFPIKSQGLIVVLVVELEARLVVQLVLRYGRPNLVLYPEYFWTIFWKASDKVPSSSFRFESTRYNRFSASCNFIGGIGKISKWFPNVLKNSMRIMKNKSIRNTIKRIMILFWMNNCFSVKLLGIIVKLFFN